MAESEDGLKGLEKLKEIEQMLDDEDTDIIKGQHHARYLGDDSYEIDEDTISMLVGEYDLLLIHDGMVEMIDDLPSEKIVERIKRYADKKKEKRAN